MNNPYWDHHVEKIVTNLMNKIRWNPNRALDYPQNIFKPVPNQTYVFTWTGGFRRMSHVEWKSEKTYITVTERSNPETPYDLWLPQHVMGEVRKILKQDPDALFAITFHEDRTKRDIALTPKGPRTGRWIVRGTP